MTSRLNAALSLRRSELKVSLPLEEQLAHFFFIGRTWISRGATPIRRAQASTSALNTSIGTASSNLTHWLF